MSTDNITPIHGGPKSTAPENAGPPDGDVMHPGFRESLIAEIADRQSQFWRLRNLIQCIGECVEAGKCDDLQEAVSGLVEYADGIYRALDPEKLVGRVEKEAKWEDTDEKS